MVFIEQAHITRQVIHEEGLVVSVAGCLWSQVDAVYDTPCVGIHNENRLVSRIEDYGIGGLFTDTVYRKQLPTKLSRLGGK